ncbi:MAG: hypothetical protein ACRD20_19215 [Terriglobales bacterium]
MSTTVQATHFCSVQAPNAQSVLELDGASSASPVCLTCLMAPSLSALILLIAFFVLSCSIRYVCGIQMRPKPNLRFFELYIRPPPPVLA